MVASEAGPMLELKNPPAGVMERSSVAGDLMTISPARSPAKSITEPCPWIMPPLGTARAVVKPPSRQVSNRLSLGFSSSEAATQGLVPGRSSGPLAISVGTARGRPAPVVTTCGGGASTCNAISAIASNRPG